MATSFDSPQVEFKIRKITAAVNVGRHHHLFVHQRTNSIVIQISGR